MIDSPPVQKGPVDVITLLEILDGRNINEAIEETIAAMEELQQKKDLRIQAVENCYKRGEIDKFTVQFWTQWAELEFREYDIHKKWLQYWLRLIEKKTPPEQNSASKKYDPMEDQVKIERAKTVPIENFYAGNLRTSGSRLSGICPFHEEKTPSFFIFTGTNTFHCFGCQKHGDVIDFIMLIRKYTFGEAIEFLA